MTRLHRKNFLPAFIINILLWLQVVTIVIFTSPEQRWPWPLVGLILAFFLALGFTLSLLLANSKRGFLISFAISFGLLIKALLSRQV